MSWTLVARTANRVSIFFVDNIGEDQIDPRLVGMVERQKKGVMLPQELER